MSKTMIIGDVHLGAGLSMGKPAVGGDLNSRIHDQMHIMHWILSRCIEHSVDRVIFTGDIFEDLKPESKLIVIFIDWLKQFIEYNIECHIICGNHDVKRIGSNYDSVLDIISAAQLENVYVYNSHYTLHTPKVSFTFLPFRDKRSLACNTMQEAVAKIQEKIPFELASILPTNKKVLIGHFALEGSFYVDEVDDISNEIMCPLNMFYEYDYTWMGHVHRPQVLNREPYIAHIGSMDLSDFGETKHSKIIVLIDPDSEKFFTQIKVPSRPLKRIQQSIPEDKDPTEYLLDILEQMDSSYPFERSIVRLEIKILNPDAQGLDRDRIKKFLLETKKAFHIAGFIETKVSNALVANSANIIDNQIDPKPAVKLWAEKSEMNEEEINSLIQECYSIIDEHEKRKK